MKFLKICDLFFSCSVNVLLCAAVLIKSCGYGYLSKLSRSDCRLMFAVKVTRSRSNYEWLNNVDGTSRMNLEVGGYYTPCQVCISSILFYFTDVSF